MEKPFTLYYLVKLFGKRRHAMDFLRGKLHVNRLSYFRKVEDPGRQDEDEGAYMIQPEQTRAGGHRFRCSPYPKRREHGGRDWGARESDDGETQSLVLHIDSGSRRVVFRKEVWGPLSGEFHVADVWTHSLSREEAETDISQRASTVIDRFILEYLRVNEEACSAH